VFVEGDNITNTDAADISIVTSPNLNLQPFIDTSPQHCKSAFTVVICTVIASFQFTITMLVQNNGLQTVAGFRIGGISITPPFVGT